ncbi:MAG TPA: hypothetical protein VGK19_01650 [Capsulimonadaceae bacterium]|jgi:hypothetical protein
MITKCDKKTSDAFHSLMAASQAVISPIDLFVKMGKLKPKQVEDWRFGRIAFLEAAVEGSLPEIGRILRKLAELGANAGLKQSRTVYMRWGKGSKGQLRFSKTGDINVEAAWSTHYMNAYLVDRGKRTITDITQNDPAHEPA